MSAALQLATPDLFRASLPRKPYCTDELSAGVRIRSAETAQRCRYIQPNGPSLRVWVVYDVDRHDAGAAWLDAQLPQPTWTAQNPDNGHAHLAYGLSVPVVTSEAGRAAPLRFAAAVERAYAESLRADVGYSGLIAKNPLHPHWRVTWGPSDLYPLEMLAEYVDLSAFNDRRRHVSDYGLGRNCTLFERLRKWAYGGVREYFRPQGYDSWQAAAFDKALTFNDFPAPLPLSEVKATAKSVARWTWKHFSVAGFHEVQAARGALKGARVREQGLALLAEGRSPAAVAQALGVGLSTVYDWRARGEQLASVRLTVSVQRDRMKATA